MRAGRGPEPETRRHAHRCAITGAVESGIAGTGTRSQHRLRRPDAVDAEAPRRIAWKAVLLAQALAPSPASGPARSARGPTAGSARVLLAAGPAGYDQRQMRAPAAGDQRGLSADVVDRIEDGIGTGEQAGGVLGVRKSSTASTVRRPGLIRADALASTSTFARPNSPVECRQPLDLTLDSWTMSRSMIRQRADRTARQCLDGLSYPTPDADDHDARAARRSRRERRRHTQPGDAGKRRSGLRIDRISGEAGKQTRAVQTGRQGWQ